MAVTVKMIASETLMCALKSVPIAGKAVEVVDAVRTRHELTCIDQKLRNLEDGLTNVDRRVRDVVCQEIENVLGSLRQPGLDGRQLEGQVREYRAIQQLGYNPALFEGLLRNSPHWEELRRNPQNYGDVLNDGQAVNPNRIQILIDADKTRILELTPHGFAALLAHQHSSGDGPPRIVQTADVWAFSQLRAGPLFLDLGGGVRLEMLLVPAGSFQMGSRLRPEEVVKRYGGLAEWTKFYQAEHPRHPVTISQPFYLAKHPVTVAQFRRFVEETGHRTDAEKGGQDFENGKKGGYTIQSDGDWGWNESATWRNPGFPQDANHPVVLVSWNDAQAFCGWLRKKTGQTIALPTEAQWEYACRAGTETEFWWGDEMDKTGQVANVADCSAKKKYPGWLVADMDDGHVYTSPVGIYRPNGFGLHDMIGNVWEWCADWFDENYYANSPRVDPIGPGTGSVRVLRGGSWINDPANCRAAFRDWSGPAYRDHHVGWRVAVGTL